MSGRRIIILRHGRTTMNHEGRFQGQLDVELDPVGARQAFEAAVALRAYEPDRLVSSDLRRAADSAKIVGKVLGLPVETDPQLREINVGTWEGLTRAQIHERWPEDFMAWQAGEDVAFGGAERRSEVGARVMGAIERYADELGDDQTLLVTTHGAAMKITVMRLLGLSFEANAAFGGFGNCHWVTLEERMVVGVDGQRWRLIEYNVGPPDTEEGAEE